MPVNERKHAKVATTDTLNIKITLNELMDEAERSVSREKRMRVEGYSNSREVTSSLSYRDNDITHSIVNAKPYKRSVSQINFEEAR